MKNTENLRTVIRTVQDPEFAKAHLKAETSRIAKMLREAQARVKANKARNDGIYDPSR